MATYTVDTAKAISDLEETGLSHDQAEAIISVFATSHEELATKKDLELFEAKLMSEIQTVRGEVQTFGNDINALKNYFLFRLAFAQIASIGVLFGLIKFFAS